jgi:hypothetical protein
MVRRRIGWLVWDSGLDTDILRVRFFFFCNATFVRTRTYRLLRRGIVLDGCADDPERLAAD